MMKIYFRHWGCIIALFLIWTSCFSQKKHIFELPKPNKEIENINFYAGEVIDSRYDTTTIGWVYKGIFKKKIDCCLKGGTQSQLKSFFEKLTPPKTDKEKITVQIMSLSVSEGSSFPETAICKLEAQFIDNTGQLVYEVTLNENKKGFDATNSHPQLISETLIKALELYKLSRQTYGKFVPHKNKKNLENHLLISKTPQKGFYSSFEELQADNPSIRPNFEIYKDENYKSDRINISLMDSSLDKNKLLNLIWGFSDGKNVYIRAPSEKSRLSFNIIKNIGRYAHFIDFRSEKRKGPAPLIKETEKEFVIDMKTGIIWSFNQTTLQRILVQDPKIFDVYAKQPMERKEFLKDFWLEQFNIRYIEKIKNHKKAGSTM